MSVWVYMMCVPMPKEAKGFESPGARVTRCLRECWEQNSGSLEEQQVFLFTGEPYLRPQQRFSNWIMFRGLTIQPMPGYKIPASPPVYPCHTQFFRLGLSLINWTKLSSNILYNFYGICRPWCTVYHMIVCRVFHLCFIWVCHLLIKILSSLWAWLD